jgi:hypothetical protein
MDYSVTENATKLPSKTVQNDTAILAPSAFLQSGVIAKEVYTIKQIQLNTVFAYIGGIRSLVSEFYATEGRYPESFNDFGVNERFYDTVKLVKRIQFSTLGEFRIDLDSNAFGKDKYMIYKYKYDANKMGLMWSCFNNLDRTIIYFECEEIT